MTNILHFRPSDVVSGAAAIPAPKTEKAAPVVSSTSVHAHQSEIIPSLDGIRALSVLIVVAGHCGLQALVPGGFGVTIFFFLSGFLISTLMLAEHARTGRINVPNFYARRMFRLMPPLLLSLAVAYGLTYSDVLGGGITGQGIAAQLLYFANYYGLFFDSGNTVPDGTGILWSLAVEEHFYIVYPLLMTLLLGCALRLRTIGALLGLICLAVLAWRIHLVHAPDFFPDRTYYASDTRIDSIAYGCILALIMNPARQRSGAVAMSLAQWALLAGAAGALLFTLLYRDPTFRETARYSVQGLALMPVFYLAVRFADAPPFRLINKSWMMTLGIYSYAIYLIHYVIIMAIAHTLPAVAAKPYVVFPATLLISIGYAAVIERFVEPYFRQLRHKFRTEPTREPAALAATEGLSVILATAAAGGTIAAVRSLGTRGVDVDVVSSERLGAAAWSRYAKRTFSAPPESDSQRFLERLLAIGKSNPGRILLPTSDETAWIYAENAHLLQRHFRLYHPPISSLRRILDKKLFSDAAISAGLSVLPSWDPSSPEELAALAPTLPFPILIKPRTHVHRVRNDKGVVVDSPHELLLQYRRFVDREQERVADTPLLPDAKRPLLQKFVHVSGEGVLSITGFIDRSGELFVTRAAKKVLQRSQPVGVGVCFEAQPSPENLSDLVRHLCHELDYFGLFEVEFVRFDGRWAIIDFNPRMFSQVGMDIRRGMPLPLLACLDAVGDSASLRREVAKAQVGDDEQAVFRDRFTLRAILLARVLTAGISNQELSKWHGWMKQHAGHAVDFATDRDDLMPGIVHAFSEVYLGLRSLPRFLRAKPRTGIADAVSI